MDWNWFSQFAGFRDGSPAQTASDKGARVYGFVQNDAMFLCVYCPAQTKDFTEKMFTLCCPRCTEKCLHSVILAAAEKCLHSVILAALRSIYTLLSSLH